MFSNVKLTSKLMHDISIGARGFSNTAVTVGC